MPFLKEMYFDWSLVNDNRAKAKYPFSISAFKGIKSLHFETNVTFFIGENGSGKSTLLESLATLCGFSTIGGRSSLIERGNDDTSLTSVIKLSWMPKVKNGFFFRAETFDTFADYLDELKKDPLEGHKAYSSYGGKSLNEQSHGQAFISLFTNRFGRRGIYLLDEPEAALSPQNQLAFLKTVRELENTGYAQFIIATHSPILMAYPGATIYSFDYSPITKVDYEMTDHFILTRDFLNNRDRYFKVLFE